MAEPQLTDAATSHLLTSAGEAVARRYGARSVPSVFVSTAA